MVDDPTISETIKGSRPKVGLSAYLSPLAIVALSFGYAVGWGAFIMPGTSFLPGAGPLGTIIGILLGAAAMSVFALNYHRMVQRAPGPGGAFAFALKAFGADHGFLIAWFLFLTYVAILWANATALVLLVRYLFGDALRFGLHYALAGFDVYLGEVMVCVLAIAFAGCACIFRKRFAVRLHTLLAVLFAVGVAVCFCAALWRHEGGLASMAPAFSGGGGATGQVLRILAMVPWAFVGFEAVVNSSGEFRFPARRTFWLMLAAIAISAMVYVFLALLPVIALPEGYANWADYIAALPGLKGVDAVPVFAAAKSVFGPLGVPLIGGIMFAAQMTGIIGTFVAGSRLMYAMSKGGMIPIRFAALNKDGTPVTAVLFIMCTSFAMPFFGWTVTGWPVDISNIGAAIAYGYTSAAAFAVTVDDGSRRAFFAKAAGLLGVVMAAVFCLLMLVPDFISGSTLSAESYLLLSIWCLLGFLQYRHVFLSDWLSRFGHSVVVWIGVLIIIFFSSLMWLRLAVCDAAADSYARLVGTTVTQQSFDEIVGRVNADMLQNSLVELCLLIASLAVIINLFIILSKREKSLVLAKLEAEESANRSRSYFFSTVSHDIRTPLNAILGYSQMLKMGLKTEAERDHAINSILLSGDTLLRLVNDVMDISKLEAGRMEIMPVPTDCGRLLRETAEPFCVANRKPGLEIRCRADEMPALEVDPHRIRQVLSNLLGNAVKFTETGHIEVRATFAKDAAAGAGTFRLEVEDTGCGIGADDLELISRPYEQVRAKTARHGGTGLGLAICRELATAMGGKLTVSSALGKGSTFGMTIPNVKVSAMPPTAVPSPDLLSAPATAAPSAPAAVKRVLIADDQKVNLLVLKALLSKLGPFEITMAADGKKALEILEAPDAPHFDMVLTDMWMPEMDGAGLLQGIQANKKLSNLPTYVVTADVEMLKQYADTGFSGIILKPITVDKLKEIL